MTRFSQPDAASSGAAFASVKSEDLSEPDSRRVGDAVLRQEHTLDPPTRLGSVLFGRRFNQSGRSGGLVAEHHRVAGIQEDRGAAIHAD